MRSARMQRPLGGAAALLAPVLLLLLLVAFLSTTALAASVSFQVEPKEEICTFREMKQGDVFFAEFEVVRGGLLDIKLRIVEPTGRVTERLAFFNEDPASGRSRAQMQDEGKIEHRAETTGMHKVCFDNRMSRWTAKVVSLSVSKTVRNADNLQERVRADSTAGGEEDSDSVAKLEHLGPVVDSVIKISDELEELERVMLRHRVREAQHRDTQDNLHSRSQWLSVFEAIVLVVLAVFQVSHVRKWFKERTLLGRV